MTPLTNLPILAALLTTISNLPLFLVGLPASGDRGYPRSPLAGDSDSSVDAGNSDTLPAPDVVQRDLPGALWRNASAQRYNALGPGDRHVIESGPGVILEVFKIQPWYAAGKLIVRKA